MQRISHKCALVKYRALHEELRTDKALTIEQTMNQLKDDQTISRQYSVTNSSRGLYFMVPTCVEENLKKLRPMQHITFDSTFKVFPISQELGGKMLVLVQAKCNLQARRQYVTLCLAVHNSKDASAYGWIFEQFFKLFGLPKYSIVDEDDLYKMDENPIYYGVTMDQCGGEAMGYIEAMVRAISNSPEEVAAKNLTLETIPFTMRLCIFHVKSRCRLMLQKLKSLSPEVKRELCLTYTGAFGEAPSNDNKASIFDKMRSICSNGRGWHDIRNGKTLKQELKELFEAPLEGQFADALQEDHKIAIRRWFKSFSEDAHTTIKLENGELLKTTRAEYALCINNNRALLANTTNASESMHSVVKRGGKEKDFHESMKKIIEKCDKNVEDVKHYLTHGETVLRRGTNKTSRKSREYGSAIVVPFRQDKNSFAVSSLVFLQSIGRWCMKTKAISEKVEKLSKQFEDKDWILDKNKSLLALLFNSNKQIPGRDIYLMDTSCFTEMLDLHTVVEQDVCEFFENAIRVFENDIWKNVFEHFSNGYVCQTHNGIYCKTVESSMLHVSVLLQPSKDFKTCLHESLDESRPQETVRCNLGTNSEEHCVLSSNLNLKSIMLMVFIDRIDRSLELNLPLGKSLKLNSSFLEGWNLVSFIVHRHGDATFGDHYFCVYRSTQGWYKADFDKKTNLNIEQVLTYLSRARVLSFLNPEYNWVCPEPPVQAEEPFKLGNERVCNIKGESNDISINVVNGCPSNELGNGESDDPVDVRNVSNPRTMNSVLEQSVEVISISSSEPVNGEYDYPVVIHNVTEPGKNVDSIKPKTEYKDDVDLLYHPLYFSNILGNLKYHGLTIRDLKEDSYLSDFIVGTLFSPW